MILTGCESLDKSLRLNPSRKAYEKSRKEIADVNVTFFKTL